MAIQLRKGENINLTKQAPTLNKIVVGLGWDARSTDGKDFDLDASCFLLTAAGKCRDDRDMVFYQKGHLSHFEGAVLHTGDNKTGAGAGDDEQIKVDLGAVDAAVKHIVFAVTSYRGQKFTSVKNAFVRIVDEATGKELCRYSLSDQFPNTGVIMARLYRHNGEWKFAAIGEPADGRTVLDLKAKMQASIG